MNRARDAAGRPLPPGEPGVPPIVVPANLTPEDALQLADDALDDGRPFAAHEVLEEMWKQRPAAERNFWRGLTQVAVALTHVQRDNMTGAIALFDRAASLLTGEQARYGVDVNALGEEAHRLATTSADQATRLRASTADIRFTRKRSAIRRTSSAAGPSSG